MMLAAASASKIRLLRTAMLVLAFADGLLGVWLLFAPTHFMTLMQIPIHGEPIFVRESGSYMLFAGLLCALVYADPVRNVATCQATVVYRALACAIEIVAVVWLLDAGRFRSVFTLCAFLDGSLSLLTIFLMRRAGLPWVPFQRVSA